MPTNRNSIAQQRAKFAWSYRNEVANNHMEKYRSHVREFPMLVLTNGLLPAVAFAYEKGEKGSDQGWKYVYRHLESWLKKDQPNPEETKDSLIVLLLNIEAEDSARMRNLSNEAISLFTWLKRFVNDNG